MSQISLLVNLCTVMLGGVLNTGPQWLLTSRSRSDICVSRYLDAVTHGRRTRSLVQMCICFETPELLALKKEKLPSIARHLPKLPYKIICTSVTETGYFSSFQD